jgi:hypothetical protein
MVRRTHNYKQYGLSLERYEEMFEEQNGLCAICENPDSTGRLLGVDHDHESGTIRGLLCSNCNTALGLVKEDPEILSRMIDYLEAH